MFSLIMPDLFCHALVSLLPNFLFGFMLQGRTGRLDELPRGLWKGAHISMSRSSTTSFMGLVDRNTVLWSLSTKAPETRAAELRALFQDPIAVQVRLWSSVKLVPQPRDGPLSPLCPTNQHFISMRLIERIPSQRE